MTTQQKINELESDARYHRKEEELHRFKAENSEKLLKELREINPTGIKLIDTLTENFLTNTEAK